MRADLVITAEFGVDGKTERLRVRLPRDRKSKEEKIDIRSRLRSTLGKGGTIRSSIADHSRALNSKWIRQGSGQGQGLRQRSILVAASATTGALPKLPTIDYDYDYDLRVDFEPGFNLVIPRPGMPERGR